MKRFTAPSPPKTGFQFRGARSAGRLRGPHHGLRDYSLNGWRIQERPNEAGEEWAWTAEAGRWPRFGAPEIARRGFRTQEAAERFCIANHPPRYPGDLPVENDR